MGEWLELQALANCVQRAGAQGVGGMWALTRKHMKSRARTVGTPPKGRPCRTVLRMRAL